ncbi:MAG: hypothetical protein GY774_20880 [Planctomycetes bacterium]|nr:hypothetical protein [Planctomycetota bacterium]
MTWQRRVRTGRIPRHLRAGILTRARLRLPTRNVKWLLNLQRGDWVGALAVDLVDFVTAIPEVDITVELFRLRDPGLLGSELVSIFRGYLEQRHTTELPSTPYFVFYVDRVRIKRDLGAALGINLDNLFERTRLPQPHEMTGRQRQQHVLLTYASFPTEIERYVPQELHFQTGTAIRGVSTSGGENLEPDETPEQLIDRFTSWNNLNETGLGAYLVELTRRSPALSRYAARVLDELGNTDRDDVSLAFAEAATGRDLARLRRNIHGLALLERLFDELTSGSIGEDEQRQANRIMLSRARFRGVEAAAEQLAGRRHLVFPFRMPGPTVLNPSPISAERIGGGRIRVRLYSTQSGASMFRAETRTLPSHVFTSGLVLDADEWISVKLYDEGGIIVHRPAMYLVELSNRTTQRTLENIVNVAALGLTFGAGSLAIRGATWGARALAALDTAATALFAVSIVVRDHRGWIIRTFGEAGRSFVDGVEVAGALAGVYGIGRVVMSTPRVIANLRNAWRNWRTSRAYQNLSGDDLRQAELISREAEQFLNSADEAASAAGREGVPSGSEAPGTAITRPAGGATGAAEESSRVILYRGTVYRFIRGRSRYVHDLGEGVYMTLERELAIRYAQERRVQIQSSEPGAPGIVLRVEAESGELGRVLDFYNNRALRAEWETFLSRQPGGEMVLRGGPAEVYNGHFENWLQSKGLRPDQFDVIIGPEYIRGGSQACIRNESIAESLLRRAKEWARAHEPVTSAYPEVPPLE